MHALQLVKDFLLSLVFNSAAQVGSEIAGTSRVVVQDHQGVVAQDHEDNPLEDMSPRDKRDLV